MNEETVKTIENLESSLGKIINKENVIYFLTYDTKNNPRASVKYIYDLALKLKNSEYNVKILVEEKSYSGVKGWLGNRYDTIPTVSIKDDKPVINVEDIIIVPEYFSNVLPQLLNIRCGKIMLVQQKEYVFDTLNVGSRWSEYGFDKCITTTKESKRYLDEFFPSTLTYVIPPYIEDIFSETKKPQKPFIAIHCRERVKNKKIISEFYLKYPHLRWITFRDMVQLSYDDFADSLKECMVSVWIDDESTFGTFPLESMKCNIPVIGKIPNTKPDWLGDSGIWVNDESDIIEMLSTYVTSWIDNQDLYDDFKEKMADTVALYDKTNFDNNVESIFNTIFTNRIELFTTSINTLKTKEE